MTLALPADMRPKVQINEITVTNKHLHRTLTATFIW